MTYTELKAKQQREMDGFQGIFFAFNNDQFREGMESIGLKQEDTGKIYSIGGGGYILKERSKDLHAMFERWGQEKEDLKKQEDTLLEALVYELRNHEYCITGDTGPALNALGWDKKDIDPKLLKEAITLAV